MTKYLLLGALSAGCLLNAQPAKRPTKPIEVVKAFLAAMAKKDFATALPYVAENCVYDNVPKGVVRGPEGVRAVLEPFFAPILENEFVLLREATKGPLVFIERLDRHRMPDGWVELPVTGVWEVHNGRITLWREYFDAGTLPKQKAWPKPPV